MKSFLSLTMALLLGISLAGCGGSSEHATASAGGDAGTPAAPAGEAGMQDASAADTNAATTAEEFSVEEQVLYDQDGIKITVTGASVGRAASSITGKEWTNYYVGLQIDNNTSHGIKISQGNAFINGYAMQAPHNEYLLEYLTEDPFAFLGSYELDIPAGESITPRLRYGDVSLDFLPLEERVPVQWLWQPYCRNIDAPNEPAVQLPLLEIVTSYAGSVGVDPIPAGDIVYEDDNVSVAAENLIFDENTNSYRFIFNVKNVSDIPVAVFIHYRDDGTGWFNATTASDNLMSGFVTTVSASLSLDDLADYYGLDNAADLAEFAYTVEIRPNGSDADRYTTETLVLDHDWITAHNDSRKDDAA